LSCATSDTAPGIASANETSSVEIKNRMAVFLGGTAKKDTRVVSASEQHSDAEFDRLLGQPHLQIER
jgi:hypothetical protein